jgi:hypothetical protein
MALVAAERADRAASIKAMCAAAAAAVLAAQRADLAA